MEKELMITPIAKLWQLGPKLLRVEYLPVVTETEKIDAHFALLTEHFGKELYMLVDIRQVRSANAKARRHIAKNNDVTAAAAIIVNNGPSAIIGNFFLRFDGPPFPAKLFTQEEKALNWLNKQN
ncbi:hypothetical protein [Saprospira grandis]|uniref:DUF7793 family protein n=1 Tax=Saprospira grandis TaxID=1008 RepID=UPI0022DDF23F|nr:hypothetical protein [Saprospira grandis]WBM74185.1 hypothetical protein OP864_14450 [Saprospira grandis]